MRFVTCFWEITWLSLSPRYCKRIENSGYWMRKVMYRWPVADRSMYQIILMYSIKIGLTCHFNTLSPGLCFFKFFFFIGVFFLRIFSNNLSVSDIIGKVYLSVRWKEFQQTSILINSHPPDKEIRRILLINHAIMAHNLEYLFFWFNSRISQKQCYRNWIYI